ncbi:MAG: restriction endonuclease subunit S [Cyanobium sp.]
MDQGAGGDAAMRWPSVPVSEIAKQVRGVSYDKSQVSNNPSQGLIPILRAGNIQDGSLLLNQDLVFVPESCVSSQQLLRPGDIVVAASSGSLDVVGKAAQIQKPWQGSFGAFCKVVRSTSDRIDPRYLHHFFQSSGYRRKVSSLAAGANINNLKNEHIDDLEIPLPPLEEQRRIAAILDKADQLDKNRLSAIQSVEALQGSLFNEISNASMYPNKNLEQYRLSDLLEIPLRNGLSPSTEGSVEFSVLTLSAITRGRFKLESTKKGIFNSIPPREKTVNREDFLICRGNGNLNLVGLGEFPGTTDESTAFPDTIIAARLRHELVNPTYFATAWKQQSIRSQILGKSRTTNGTHKINQASLESIVISLPSLERQAAFAGRIAPLRALAEKHESSMLARLAELKSSIIDHFLYGNQ